VYKTEGKKTRLYTSDKGGIAVLQPYINLGIVDVVALENTDPFMFLHKSTSGAVRDKDGKWVNGISDEIGVYAFESMRSYAEELLSNMAIKAGKGVSIGGTGNVSFDVRDGSDSLKVSGTNMAMYGVAQAQMTEKIWASQKLPGSYIIWTSSVSKDDDPTASGKILGPDVIGRALTADVPRWFDFTFRMDVVPAKAGKAERHIMYLGTHIDVNAGNAAGMGNVRRPLDAPELKQVTIEPANIAEALKIADEGSDKATEVLKARLGL